MPRVIVFGPRMKHVLLMLVTKVWMEGIDGLGRNVVPINARMYSMYLLTHTHTHSHAHSIIHSLTQSIKCLQTRPSSYLQVTTRLLFSACPATHWTLVKLWLNFAGTRDKNLSQDTHLGTPLSPPLFIPPLTEYRSVHRGVVNAAYVWCMVYMFLGLILHCNGLPWT